MQWICLLIYYTLVYHINTYGTYSVLRKKPMEINQGRTKSGMVLIKWWAMVLNQCCGENYGN